MASSSHNGALIAGLLLGAAGGAVWALWNANEPGAALQARVRGYIDGALGRAHLELPLPTVTISNPFSSEPKPLGTAQSETVRPIESTVIVQSH